MIDQKQNPASICVKQHYVPKTAMKIKYLTDNGRNKPNSYLALSSGSGTHLGISANAFF